MRGLTPPPAPLLRAVWPTMPSPPPPLLAPPPPTQGCVADYPPLPSPPLPSPPPPLLLPSPQGCVADYAVVMANLVMDGKSLGPHAFVMQV